VGFGINASLNQNELRLHREASNKQIQQQALKSVKNGQHFSASHPSQGDLLEMIDS
jgi:hypothetical protein